MTGAIVALFLQQQQLILNCCKIGTISEAGAYLAQQLEELVNHSFDPIVSTLP